MVGAGSIISVGAIVDHDALLESAVHINAGAVVKAGEWSVPLKTGGRRSTAWISSPYRWNLYASAGTKTDQILSGDPDMSSDKKNIKKILAVSAGAVGTAFVCTRLLAQKKKGDSIYEKDAGQKNPMEGKRVIFVMDENDAENADGIRGHLEAVGDACYVPGIYGRYIKRGLDIILSFGGLVLLAPVYAGIAAAIKIDDPGPVFFTQKRLGQNKQYFKLHKFRSMKMATPHDVPTHMLENPDQYITRVGRFLRAHSLDELPQIWDIFIGNMSVIGPRPGLWNQDVLTAERDKYGANDVKPGLTGWAQVNGLRGDSSIKKRIEYDIYYIENWTVGLDIKILFLTVFRGFVNKNAY